MDLHGLHHVTAVTGRVGHNYDFYTRVLGLRLVKKTVNQDDTSAYHMFYADKLGTPGTDITFFDWPQTGQGRRGTDSVVNTLFRVNGRAALDYWVQRFEALGVKHGDIQRFAGRERLAFEDTEGQRLVLVDDGGALFEGEPYEAAGIPAEYALRGFYGVTLSVPRLGMIEPILTRILNFTETGRYGNPDNPSEEVTVYTLAGGGPGKEVHVIEQPTLQRGWLGAGGVHHVAFRVKDDAEQLAWRQRLVEAGVGVSGHIDRFYFHSIYFRISNGILFEVATDGPGFATDESLETMGEGLALPPFLEPQRAQIEAGLKPIVVPQVS